MGKKKTTSLKLAHNGFGRLPRRRDSNSLQQSGGFALKFSRIQKVRVGRGGNACKQESADVNGPIPRGPFQALKPARYVFRRRGLSAPVAGQGMCGHGLQARIVVEWRTECKSGKPALQAVLRSHVAREQAFTIRRRRLCAGDGNLGFGVAQPPSCDDTCTFSFKHEMKLIVALDANLFVR